MQYVVAVRALCEFTAKQGSLDLRFTPSPTSEEGIAGHKLVAVRRGSSYEREISLKGAFKHLTVRGRADGYDAAKNQLEEIKTHRGDLGKQPDNHRHLHWAQIKIYGWLLCEARGLSELTLALVYLDIASQEETLFTETLSAAALQLFFEQQCGRFLAWADQELAHRTARNASLSALQFPHASFRTGQRELAEAVYRSASSGRCLMAQAPTGIGKTIGTVFPLLKAVPGQDLDKLVFLAAKAPGRQLALDALGLIAQGAPALRLRVLELTAREKACEHPDKACHGDSCELARGFYDRLPEARAEALQAGSMDRSTIRDVALRHAVCPYYLGQELARWADVVVGDYNYYFDTSALLHALTLANEWRIGVLVDEAHNMIERARGMYTAELRQSALRSVRRSAPVPVAKRMDKLQRCWSALLKEQDQPYQAHDACPDKLVFALLQVAAAIAEHLAESPAQADGALQQFYFEVLQFTRLAESFGAHSLFDVTRVAGAATHRAQDSILCIRNLIPAPFLAPRFAAARSVALFSATLSPRAFYQDALGMPGDTSWVDVASPFEPEQLAVKVVSSISTRFADRQRSAQPIAQLIAAQYRQQPGNYLAFFSSYDYLQMVVSEFAEQHAEIPMWQQARNMSEDQRRQFLERFVPTGTGVGFSVLGGSFAEGIDLPGDRLVGAFIATLGLPQINAVNEQMKQRMGQEFGAGYDYTYLFPGIRKVVQAAGRVIRTREDKGVIYLIDDRFNHAAVRRLLPSWWRISTVR
ncbi:MAG TPA: helicase C-terminal domain-containing protein [Burkholderiaceae bacterium]|nr:helicase C-terminal domain-containing protein [Burkholderiaceae bacterium]